MYLTTLTGTQVIETAHHQQIFIQTPKSVINNLGYTDSRSVWDADTPPGSPTMENGGEKLEDNAPSALVFPIAVPLEPAAITIASGIAYAVFIGDELIELFQQIHEVYVGMKSSRLGNSATTIESLARSRFDLINPKLTINTGPVVLNAVLDALWSTPLGEVKCCYILRREEFVGCFLSWANKQAARATFAGESRKPTNYSEIPITRRHRVRMPIGWTCVSTSKVLPCQFENMANF